MAKEASVAVGGATDLGTPGNVRVRYLNAVREADRHNFVSLIEFMDMPGG
jgi:hypothetical protein